MWLGRTLPHPARLLGLPASALMSAAYHRAAQARPEAARRFKGLEGRQCLIAPEGLPAAFCITLGPPWHIRVTAPSESADAAIRGPLRQLLRLMDGSEDADAAFFARSVQVEGNLAVATALRHALEDAELDLWRFAVAFAHVRKQQG